MLAVCHTARECRMWAGVEARARDRAMQRAREFQSYTRDDPQQRLGPKRAENARKVARRYALIARDAQLRRIRWRLASRRATP